MYPSCIRGLTDIQAGARIQTHWVHKELLGSWRGSKQQVTPGHIWKTGNIWHVPFVKDRSSNDIPKTASCDVKYLDSFIVDSWEVISRHSSGNLFKKERKSVSLHNVTSCNKEASTWKECNIFPRSPLI